MRALPTRNLLLVLILPIRLHASEPNFESPPVHPLERTPDGTRLLAVNTDDHRLSVFDLTGSPVPVLLAEIPVGLEPVTVRARSNTEAWVVNHLSDSITRIDLVDLRVTATFPVGDEPTDVVFAGSPERAFVCLSQEDRILVLDPVSGAETASLPLEASEPHALAVSPSGDRVYAGMLDSGNGTTTVPEAVVDSTLGLPPAVPAPDSTLPPPPVTALVVQRRDGVWRDEADRDWNAQVPYTVLDHDIAVIDANSPAVLGYVGEVGTALFDLAVDPVTGTIHAANQEAHNLIRFEPNLNGRFVTSRVTRVDPATGTATPVDLNSHVDLDVPGGSPAERTLSLSLPLAIAAAPDGQTYYLAAFGSAKVAVLDATGAVLDRLPVGNGPAGVTLAGNTLYVLNAIDATLTTLDLTGIDAPVTVPLGFDVIPDDVRAGRRLFYDATAASGHGTVSCASCHLFGGMDNLAWDLGDPLGQVVPPPPTTPGLSGFHPMKGPLMTQSLKGLPGSTPFHWRGDRPDLAAFNVTFADLLGGTPLSPADLADFETFVNGLAYPPNPYRELDGSLPDPPSGPNPTLGKALFETGNLIGSGQCTACHGQANGMIPFVIPGTVLGGSQDFVIPQLRNLYEKTRFDPGAGTTVRGFGFTHAGTVPDLVAFHRSPRFVFPGDAEREHVASYLFRFDTGTHAAVGAQWTMDGSNTAAGTPRLDILEAVADTAGIDLVVKGRDPAGRDRGWVYAGAGLYTADRASDPAWSRIDLLVLADPGTELTWTAVPPGCGERLGIDRDRDGYRDTDETDAGSNPADPLSTPETLGFPDGPTAPLRLLALYPNPIRAGRAILEFSLAAPAPVSIRVHDVRGRMVRRLAEADPLPAGPGGLSWDLRDDAGREVAGGIYFVRVVTPEGSTGGRVVVIR